MSLDLVMALAVLALAVGVLVTERLRADLVAVLVLLVLTLTGLVSPAEAVSGFSSPAVVTIGGVFLLSAGLQRTGVANWLAHGIERAGRGNETRLVLALMTTVAGLSFFMNTMAIVALFLPAVMDVARRTGLKPSRLLMPLTFGALLGGLTTLFATLPNLLASTALKEAGLEPFGVFDFLPVGGAAALAGIGYMTFLGRRLLPARDLQQETSAARGANLHESYELHERMFVLHLPAGCSLDGRSLEESRLGSALGLHVVGILRNGQTHLAPERSTVLRAEDRLLIQGTPDQLSELDAWRGLQLGEGPADLELWFPASLAFAEARLAADSRFVGQTLPWLQARRTWGVNVVAIRRGATVRRSHLQEWRLQAGDVLLLHGPQDRLQALQAVGAWEQFRLLSRDELAATYDLQSRLFTLRLPEDSPLAGHTLAQSRLGEALGFAVLGLVRGEQKVLMPGPEQVLEAGDRLLVQGRSEDLLVLQGLKDLRLERQVAPEFTEFESEQLGMIEAVLSPRTSLAGKTLRQLRFRDRYGVSVLGVWRAGKAQTTRLRDLALAFGDALLLYGPHAKLKLLAREPDFIVLTQAVQEPPLTAKAPAALASMAVFLLLAATGWMPVYVAALLGGALMVLLGCLRLDEAYGAVEWRAVVLIAGMLPLATALEHTGAARLIAGGFLKLIEGAGAPGIVAGLFLATSLGACAIPGAAMVVLMAPIALKTAAQSGVSPHAAMMAVALAAAGSFNSPVSHPSNVLIMGPGGYRFVDFFKVGIPLTLIVLAVVLLVLPRFWPLGVN